MHNVVPVGTPYGVAAPSLRGVQQRLNRLGYHLRGPGRVNPGVDNSLGGATERAILDFQVDYRPLVGAPAAAANRLRIRGEWNTNTGIQANLNWYANSPPRPTPPNPSAADGRAFQAALDAVVP